jgi:hypothetical protein
VSYQIVPGRPEDWGKSGSHERPVTDEHPVGEVGEFRQGSDASHWILRRYLLSRALGDSIVRSVHWFGVSIFVLAVLTWVGGIRWLAVLIALVAVMLLLLRVALSGAQRRLSGSDRLGAAAPQIQELVGHTRRGLRAELRRVGLPSAPWGPLLIGLRLIRASRRARTVHQLTQIDLAKVVPSSRVDELHLLLNGRPPFDPPPWQR